MVVFLPRRSYQILNFLQKVHISLFVANFRFWDDLVFFSRLFYCSATAVHFDWIWLLLLFLFCFLYEMLFDWLRLILKFAVIIVGACDNFSILSSFHFFLKFIIIAVYDNIIDGFSAGIVLLEMFVF